MARLLSMIESATPEIAVSVSGEYYPGVTEKIRNYNIPFNSMPDGIQSIAIKRRNDSSRTILYTGCEVSQPNTFTFSGHAEASYLPLFAAASMLDGYMGMGFNNWPDDPFTDSRNNHSPGGTGYLVYPGPESSVRFELLRDGIEEYEKIRILQGMLSSDPSPAAAAAEEKLKRFLDEVYRDILDSRTAAEIVKEGKSLADSIAASVSRQ